MGASGHDHLVSLSAANFTTLANGSLDPDVLYRALQARDGRYDGRFFVGVNTAGVYCRPVCVARTPERDRCRFYARAVEGERDGFRACFRCRPELAPVLNTFFGG